MKLNSVLPEQIFSSESSTNFRAFSHNTSGIIASKHESKDNSLKTAAYFRRTSKVSPCNPINESNAGMDISGRYVFKLSTDETVPS